MFTYIIRTQRGEYYIGKTVDIDRRMKEHRSEKYPHWFGYNESRKYFDVVLVVAGDFEKQMKRMGAKNIMYILNNLVTSAP